MFLGQPFVILQCLLQMTVESEVWPGAAMRPPLSFNRLVLVLTSLTTTIRLDTVLYNYNMQLKRFVMMAYCFTQQIKTVAQTINECSFRTKNAVIPPYPITL